MIPVCLRCNDVGKSEAIVMGTSHFLPNDSIENELVKCKHEVVSKALYIHSIVDVVESQNKTISDGGITVDFCFLKVHTSN